MATSLRKFTILVSCTIFLQLLSLDIADSTYAFGLDNSRTPRKTLLTSEGGGLLSTLQHMLDQCLQKKDIFWCFKIQGSRLLGRALKFTNIQIIDGISLVKRPTSDDNHNQSAGQGYNERGGKLETGRSQSDQLNLSNRDLENLSLKSLDSLLSERFVTFVRSRQVQVNMPRLLAFGRKSSHDLWNKVFDPIIKTWSTESKTVAQNLGEGVEGRKKKGGQNFLGPFVAAVLLKTAILKMAYHSIAIVAGKALVVGKIALIISAIIGLKKLVSSDGEKTTYEIVKHPQMSQSHTYSSSHAGDYEAGHEGGGSGGGGGGGGSYHRSMDDEMMMQDKAYNAWVPSHPSPMS